MTVRKAYKGLPMEGPIATWYTKITGGERRHGSMAGLLARQIPAGASVLEIAPGPGFFCIELARLGNFRITGLDISKSFVEIARRNAAEAGVQVTFRQGNASDQPFESGSFDFTFCQAAFKNFSEPVRAIAEMHRVLRAGGTAVIVDMRSDASRAEIDAEVEKMGLRAFDRFMTRWTFENMLIKSAYSVEQMRAFVAQTPFKAPRIDVEGVGFTVWLKK